MMTLQALVYDPRAANDKRQFIEIWLDHYMSEPNAFFFFRLAQMPPKGSIQSSVKSLHSSLQPSLSTSSSLSNRLDAGTETVKSGAKRVARATKINARPLKRTKCAVSNSSSRAGIDAEAYDPSLDDPVCAGGNDASETNEVSAGEEADSDKLEEELGKSHIILLFVLC